MATLATLTEQYLFRMMTLVRWDDLCRQNQHAAVTATTRQVEFFDPVTGKPTDATRVNVWDQCLPIAIREFQGAVAIQLKRFAP